MDKKALKKELENSFKAILVDLEGISNESFYQNKGSKWSAAQNLAQLTLSAKIFRRAPTAPKWALVFRFGLNFQKQWDLNWIRKTYNEATFPVTAGFEPQMSSDTSLEYEKEQFIKQNKAILENLDSWSKWRINLFKLPQLVLGKLSVREMSLFFSFHIKHHHKAIRLALA